MYLSEIKSNQIKNQTPKGDFLALEIASMSYVNKELIQRSS